MFETEFSFDLDKQLLKKGLKLAAKQLAGYQAANEYIGAWVMQRSLGGHAIPLDAPILRCSSLGLLDGAGDDVDGARRSLEHLVPKAKGQHFTELVSCLAGKCCWKESRLARPVPVDGMRRCQKPAPRTKRTATAVARNGVKNVLASEGRTPLARRSDDIPGFRSGHQPIDVGRAADVVGVHHTDVIGAGRRQYRLDGELASVFYIVIARDDTALGVVKREQRKSMRAAAAAVVVVVVRCSRFTTPKAVSSQAMTMWDGYGRFAHRDDIAGDRRLLRQCGGRQRRRQPVQRLSAGGTGEVKGCRRFDERGACDPRSPKRS